MSTKTRNTVLTVVLALIGAIALILLGNYAYACTFGNGAASAMQQDTVIHQSHPEYTFTQAPAHTYNPAYGPLYVAVPFHVDAHSPRYDACRTWVIGGYDAADGQLCGSDDTVTSRRNTSSSSSTTATTVVNIVRINIPDTPANVPAIKVHTNNGNHYGNDRPDNNTHDVNNKHNGCNVNCTGSNNTTPTNNGKGKGN